MTPLQIVILVFAILVIISFALYFVFERYLWNWYQTIFCYFAQLFMLIGGIILIVAAALKKSNQIFKSGLAMIYIADIFSLASIFVFAFWKRLPLSPGIFNWAGLVAFLINTPLIVLVHVHMAQNPDNPSLIMTGNETQAPLTPSYQNY